MGRRTHGSTDGLSRLRPPRAVDAAGHGRAADAGSGHRSTGCDGGEERHETPAGERGREPARGRAGAGDLDAGDLDAGDLDAGDLDDWGATAMPAWLDTGAGRRAWAGRSGTGERFGEVLDDLPDEPDDLDDDLEDDPDDDWSDWADPPRRRFALLPPGAVALVGIGVIACAVAVFALLRGNEAVVPLVDFPPSAGPSAPDGASPDAAGTGAPAPGPSARPAEPAEIVVSVAGLVHRPGLIRLPPDARVAQALDRAGGARDGADVLSLNLAQVLRDGDQVLVGTRENGADSVRSAVVASGAAGPGSGAGSGGAGSGGAGSGGAGSGGAGDGTAAAPGGGGGAGGRVDLNTATAADLDALPGVGPVTAQAILAWRQQHGAFASVEQLGEVDGIGPARLARLRELVAVGR